jgi:hypothetical protein
MDIENYQFGIMKVSETLANDQIIKSIDNISTVAVPLQLKAKYADQIVDGKFRYLRVWRRFANCLKIK